MNVPLEIERVFLLGKLPELPSNSIAFTIEQGYYPGGRIRKIQNADGQTSYVHTIKQGDGLIREEVEHEISEEEFVSNWPYTTNRRISKVRYKIKENNLTWEVDVFQNCNLVLAEVELPSPETEVSIPDWLEPFIVREVTYEPAFRNFNLAC